MVFQNPPEAPATNPAKPKKKKKLSKKIRELAKTGQIGPKQLANLRGSDIPKSAPRGGQGKGMAGR